MAPIIVHLDPVIVIKAGLTWGLEEILGTPVPVLSSIPTKRPTEFIRVLGAGGSEQDAVVDVPTIVIEAWATRASRAIELAQAARGLMHWFTDIAGTPVYNVTEFAGPGDLPDPLSNQARFTATYSVSMRTARTIEIS